MNLFDFMAANNGPQQQQDPADMLGGGGVGLSHGDAMTLSLLNAMRQQAQAGTQRTASPIGSIAGALGPLLAAPIQARQAEQQSMLQGLLLRAKIASLLGKNGADPTEDAYKQALTRKTNADAAGLEAQQTAAAEYQKDPAGYVAKLIASARSQTPGQAPAGGDFRSIITLPSKPGELPGVRLEQPPAESPMAQKRFELQERNSQQRFDEQNRRLDQADARAAQAQAQNDRRAHATALKDKASIVNSQIKELDQQIEMYKKDQTSRNWWWQGKSRPATPDEFAKQRELLVGQLGELRSQIQTVGQGDFDPTK
jgi:hypothetical protein